MAKSDYLKAYKKGKAARENAKKKGVVTTQARKPKKKKKKESTEPKQQSAPRQSTRTVSSHGSSKGNERRAGAHRAQQTVQKSTQQTTQKQTTRTQGGVYKASKPTQNAPSKRTGAHVTPVNAHRAGAKRVRENNSAIRKMGDIAGGATKYFGVKTARDITQATTWASKQAARNQGHGNRGKSGETHAVTKSGRLNEAQKKQVEKRRAQEAQNREQSRKMVESNYKDASYVKGGEKAVKKLKKAEERALNEAATEFSGKKNHKILGHEFSDKDIVKGGIKTAKELADYAVPYGGTTKASLKAAEGILKTGKAAKAGKILTETSEKGAKTLTKEGKDLVRTYAQKIHKGDDAAKALKEVAEKVAKSDLKTNVKKEILANALQDATLGTTIDYVKGKQRGLKGKEMAKYMGENALMNAAIGAPIAGIAGRTGKAGKQALASEIKTNINKGFAEINKFSGNDVAEMASLEARQKLGLNTAEQGKRLQELRDKAVTNRTGVAQMDVDGKLVANDKGAIKEVMTEREINEFAHLQSKYETGILQKGEARRLRELAKTVGDAYGAVQRNAVRAVDVAKKGGKVDLDNMDSSVNFWRRTGDEKRAKEAEQARIKTSMKQFNADKTTAKFISSTVDRSNGNVLIRPMDEDSLVQYLPQEKLKQLITKDADGNVKFNIPDGFTRTMPDGRKVVLIDPHSERGTAVTLAHELSHHVSKEIGKFVSAVKKFSGADWGRMLKRYEQTYREIGASDKQIDEEVACDLMADYMVGRRTDFFSYLMGEDKSLFTKMRDYVKRVISGDPDYSKDKNFKELSDMFESGYKGIVGDGTGADASFALKPPKDAGSSEKELYNLLDETQAELRGAKTPSARAEISRSIDDIKTTIAEYERRKPEAKRVQALAKSVQNDMDSTLADVAKSLGFPTHEAFEPKSVDSMLSKVVQRKKANEFLDLNDLARNKLMMNSFSDAETAIETAITALEKKGFKPIEFSIKDHADGYKGLHLIVSKHGVQAELQFTTPEHWATKNKSEEIYASVRDIKAKIDEGKRCSPRERAAVETAEMDSNNLWKNFDDKEFYGNAKTLTALQERIKNQSQGSTSSKNSDDFLSYSSKDTGEEGLTQSPSTNSSKSSIDESSDGSSQRGSDSSQVGLTQRTTRPSSSVTPSRDIKSPPKNDNKIISKEGDDGNFALSKNKQTIIAGKGSANDYLSLEHVSKKAAGTNYNEKAMAKIRKDTGWYKSNGHWQFDIDVSNMKFQNGIKALAKNKSGGIIGEEISGIDAFFKNYPDIAEGSIKFGDLGDELYKINTSKSGDKFYGITLNKQLTQNNSPLVLVYGDSSAKKPSSKLTNDTVSSALQDVVKQMDEGKLEGTDPDYLDEDLFDIEGIRKLANMSQKPVFKSKVKSAKDFGETVDKVKTQPKPTSAEQKKAYEDFKAKTEAKIDSMDEVDLMGAMDDVGYDYLWKTDIHTGEIKLIDPDWQREKFKELMLSNGSLLPTKDAIKQWDNVQEFAEDWIKTQRGKTLRELTDEMMADTDLKNVIHSTNGTVYGKNEYAAARIAYVADIIGCSDKEAAKVVKAVWNYTGVHSNPGSYGADVAELINKFTDNAPAYLMRHDDVIWHGVATNNVGKLDAIEKIWNEHGAGAVLAADVHKNAGEAGSASSWTNREETAWGFAGGKDCAIMARCHNCVTGAPIMHMSKYPNEHEILFGTHSQWTLLHFERYFDDDDVDTVVIDVIERATNAPEPDIKFALKTALGETDAEMVVARSSIVPKNNKQPQSVNGKNEADIRFALKKGKNGSGDTLENYQNALKNATTDEEKAAIQSKIDELSVKETADASKNLAEATSNGKAKPVEPNEPKPAEPTAGETTRAEPTNGDAYTRPLNVQGIIERTRRAKTADPRFINESAKRSMKEMEEQYGGSEEFNALITGYSESGKVGKYRMKKKEQAYANAKQEFDDLGYEDMTKQYFMANLDEDPNLMQARERVLCDAIDRMEAEGKMPPNVAASEKMNIVMKDSSTTTWAGNVLQAKKQWLTSTEQGRMLVVQKEIEQLEKRYKDRIKGGKLHVSEEKLKELANATGWRKDELLNEINEEIWNQIPASLMERLNEYRHCFMLFNARTHGRNVFGNTVFRFARMVSDDMERAILNSKAARKKLGKMSGKEPTDVIINKQKVSHKEIKDNKMYLYNEFRDIYDKSGSRNKFIEMGRPDGVPTVKFKAMQKLIDLNYSFLEKEDLKGALIPAFNKAYLGYCKARCPEGTELRKFMEEMTPSQKEKARAYALWEGEYATFRDSCAFSDWLTGAKQTFAGKKANTVWGTMGYRALDAVLEGALPFVKTPVNIFRRSMDYSPASLAKSIFVDLPTAKTVDEFQAGVHNLCTGMTGTAMMGVGVLLAQHGLVTVKAGEESGDAYYDRDMGFQDYSLKIPMDGKEYSWTLDWLSPMGMSLFAGAAFQKMFDKDEFDNTAALNAFFACTSPITDMSFMSSPKDTVQRFMENASRGTSDGKETDFAGALAQLIVGDMPKNYVSGFFPQLTAQMAGFIDPYQRDTKSTKENVYLKGWQSSARQLASRTMTVRALSKYADEHPELKDNPILKNLILNPKINRRGDDVKNAPEVSVKGKDVTIAVKLVNTFLNPANVKEINEDATDKELINIRNHIEDKTSNDYKFFYYNFTGNPSYDLADGKRMTYQDAYTYGKANRIEQNERIKDMLDSKSYKGMTWKMKADEVDDAHWIGTTVADLKTYTPNYAMKAMLKNNEKEKEAVKEYKRLRGETGTKVNKDYLEYYIEKERLVSRSHASGDDLYRMKGIAAVQKGDDTLLRALDIQKSKVDDIKHYWDIAKDKFGKDAKTKSFKEITDGCCSIMSNCKYADVQNPSKGVKSVSAGMVAKGYTTKDGVEIKGDQIEERVYRLLGHNWNSAQSGGGLMLKYNKDGKYSIEKIVEMKSTLRNQFDENESGSINKQEVIDYIDSLGIDSDDEKACLYEVLYSGGNYKNPYKAQIDDHLKWGENHDDEWGDGKGSGGWGRRGRRRGGWGHGGGGGGGGGTAFTPVVNTAGGAAKQTITKVKVSDVTRPSDYTKPSNLNDAYRKKAKKLRASTTTRRS